MFQVWYDQQREGQLQNVGVYLYLSLVCEKLE